MNELIVNIDGKKYYVSSRYGLFLPYDIFDDLRYLVDRLEYSEQ